MLSVPLNGVVMKWSICILVVVFFSHLASAGADFIIECHLDSDGETSPVTYILNTKKGVAEILNSESTIKGVLGTDEHFYTLYFTYNKKTNNRRVTTTIINRVTGELTESATTTSSYPDTVGKNVTGNCKARKYERKL